MAGKGMAGFVWLIFSSKERDTVHNLYFKLLLYSTVYGNIVSFLVFLAPIPTFDTIYKQKSSDGYQSIPYVVALLSASLLLYYGVLKTNATMIITINAIGIVIELAYLVLFLIYASTKEKMYTAKLMLLFNVGGFGVTMALTILLLKGQHRVNAVGWICVAFSLAVFAAPLSSMRRVIKTKSVEFMPFTPSFLHALCAATWFLYGLFVNDMLIALPNILGLLFGIIQMLLYMMYKDRNKKIAETNERNNQQEVSLDMKKLTSIQSAKPYPASQYQPQVREMDIFPIGKPIEPNNSA
ncbi:bidirectional sugar transporter SWEET9-like [Syzygium oleosum]|uniref:bidirectional sugar transporter SWEET9-like n=1 Tax=Syzygium oleosum TaxID=219896 RepID=UPI0011D25AEC|nr:bidirectional sugar transporter SWEET9-like [Syzygium oleosum]